MSHAFAAFRQEEGVHHSVSPPHDHDLNPIAERIIRTIDEIATAMRSECGAPLGFWPRIAIT